MAEQEQGPPIALPLVWVEPDSAEIMFVNQLAVQRQGDEYILTFGQQTPPMLSGSREEKAEQAKQLGYVPVRTAVRLGTTTHRLREFVAVIERLLEQQEHGEDRTNEDN